MSRLNWKNLWRGKSSEQPPPWKKTRGNRRRNFWEPIYKGDDAAPLVEGDWDPARHTGVEGVSLSADRLGSGCDASTRLEFDRKVFNTCDFKGNFHPFRMVMKNCIFYDCDFGSSVWRGAKFSKCDFERCSISQASFIDCEFRACEWLSTGMSGNELRLHRSVITTPSKFIRSAYTNTDAKLLEAKGFRVSYQLMRLERTKATVARAVLAGLSARGSERAYYEAVRVASNQSILAKLSQHRFGGERAHWLRKPCFACLAALDILELAFINAAGFVNNWGASIGKPALMGAFIVFVFGITYQFCGVSPSLTLGMLRATDLTLLVGYTKYAKEGGSNEMLYFFNMLIGFLWYSVMIPTVVSRVSRVR